MPLTKKSSHSRNAKLPSPVADSASVGAADVAADFSDYLRSDAGPSSADTASGLNSAQSNNSTNDEYLASALSLLEQLPKALQRLKAWRHLQKHAALDQQLAFVLRCSDFFASSVRQQPELLETLIRSDLCTARVWSDYSAQADNLLADVLNAGDVADGEHNADNSLESLFSREIRHWRRTEMCRIAWRDLTGLSTTSNTLAELSGLADAAVQLAEKFSWQQCVDKWGKPAGADNSKKPDDADPRLVTLAMGKLGGAELNFSSDIDLIFVFAQAGIDKGNAAEEAALTDEEFFQKQVQMIVRLLSKVTADGFVYRVDLRLRPFGSSGPLALGMDAFRHYYLTQGREWERYAMVKARAITCLLYTSPSPRDATLPRMPSSA